MSDDRKRTSERTSEGDVARTSEGDVARTSEGDVEAHRLSEGEARTSEGRASEGRSSEGETSDEGDDTKAHVLLPKTSEG